MKLETIYRYPVKSFPGEHLSSVSLTAGEGLPDDRRYAITNGIASTQDGAWLTCRSFFINAVDDGLLKYANESDEDTITLAAPNGMRLSWRKGDSASLDFANRKMTEFIAPLMPARDLPVPVITERTQTPGMLSGYWDFDDSAVSLMNLASLEAVANAMDRPLDPRRLRGNLYLADLPAWDEFKLLGKRIRIGKKRLGRSVAEFDILRPVKRCPATMVNPETGERDAPVPAALADHFGHGFCGMYAKVVSGGTISAADPIEIIGDAKTPFEIAANPTDSDPRIWPKPVEIVDTDLHPSGEVGTYARRLVIRSMSRWPLPASTPGQRFRFHLGTDLIGVALVHEQRDHTTVLHVEPSRTGDPATAYLLENVQAGDQLVASGPFGRG